MAGAVYLSFRLLPNYQDSIQKLASDLTGAEVSFHIDYAGWQGINPKLEVSDVSLVTADHSFSLSIPNIDITLNTLRSIINLTPVSKGVVINQPQIIVQTPQSTAVANNVPTLEPVASRSFASEVDQISRTVYTILQSLQLQNRVEINQGVLVIPSYQNQPFTYGFEFNWLHRGSKLAQLQLNLTPSTGQVISVEADYTRIARHEYQLAGALYDPDQRIVQQLNGRLGDVEIGDIAENGTLHFDWHLAQNDLVSLAVRGGLSHLYINEQYRFEQFSTDLILSTNDGEHLLLDVQPLVFDYRDQHYEIPNALFDLYGTDLALSVPEIDIPKWRVFFKPFLHQWEPKARISGQLSEVKVGLNLSQPLVWDQAMLEVRFSDLALLGTNQQFDFSGLSGQVNWQKNHGIIQLNSPDFYLGNNFIFTKAWPVLSLGLLADLSLSDQALTIDLHHLGLDNPKIHLHIQGSLTIPLNQPSETSADLVGVLQARKVTTEYQAFLPKEGIPQPFYDWLMLSIYGGDALDASFDFKGILSDIPYPKGDGVFKIDAQIRNAKMSPYFGWGIAENINANLHFNNQQMLANVTQGSIAGIQLTSAQLEIPDVSPNVMSHFYINAKGQAQGEDIQNYLSQIQQRPTNPRYQAYQDEMPPPVLFDYTKNLTLVGGIGFDASYDIVLGADYVSQGEPIPNDHYSGVINLDQVAFKDPNLPVSSLYGLNGEIHYDNAKVSFKPLKGFFDANAPFTLDGFIDFTQVDNPAFNLTAQATLPMALWTDHFFNHNVPIWLSTQGNFSEGSANLSYNNVLLEEMMPVRMGHSTLDWNTIAHTTQLNYQSHSENSKVTAQVDYANAQWQNLILNAHIQQLDIQKWLGLTQHFGFKEPRSSQVINPSVSNVSPTVVNTPPCLLYRNAYDCQYRGVLKGLRPTIELGIESLILPNYSLNHFALAAKSNASATTAIATAEFGQMASVTLPYDVIYPVEIKADNIFIPFDWGSDDHDQNTVNDLNASQAQPALVSMLHQPILPVLKMSMLQYLPALDIQIQNLFLGGVSIPSVTFKGNVAHQQYKMDELKFIDKDGVLLLSGQVTPQSTTVNAVFNSQDYGKLFDRVGYSKIISATAGEIKATMQWRTDDPSLYGLSAQLEFDLHNGSILTLNSNLTKYIGLLSLESYLSSLGILQNNQKGLAFKSITGNYRLREGVAQSNPTVTVETPSFSLVMSGNVDLNQQTLDQNIAFQPHFAATTAIVVGIVGTPIAGVATYFGSKFLGNTVFKNVGVVGYRIKGPWSDPETSVR